MHVRTAHAPRLVFDAGMPLASGQKPGDSSFFPATLVTSSRATSGV